MLRHAALFALLASVVTCDFQREPERHKVIIVGAGVSGFTAAVTLLEHNVTDLLILEASDRIGGRVHTVQFGGTYMEEGAEFVHGQRGNSLYELIEPYDSSTSYLEKLDKRSLIFRNTSGFTFNSTYLKDLIMKAYNIFEEDIKHFDETVDDYFHPRLETFLRTNHVSKEVGESLFHFLRLMVPKFLGRHRLRAYGFTDHAANEDDITLTWKPETKGYQTMFDVLSKRFPDPSDELPVVNKTVLGKEVTLVKQREGDVEVTCADGSTYLADHVIVTVSLGVLKKHAATMFQPPLSAEKTAAIKALGFGCLGKVYLLFPTKWWPNDGNIIVPFFSRSELQNFIANSKYGNWSATVVGIEEHWNHDRILYTTFTGEGCHKLDTLTDQQASDGFMELLDKLFGDKFDIPRPEAILKTRWATYPYTLGSYSYRSRKSDRLNITKSVLAEPICQGDKPVILFAGEATNTDYRTTGVSGALDTGRREAHNIINYLKRQV